MKPERWKPICIGVIVCSAILLFILWSEIGNTEERMIEEIQASYENGKEDGAAEAYQIGYDDGYNNGLFAAKDELDWGETSEDADNVQSTEQPEKLPDIILSDEILEYLEEMNSSCWEDLFEYVIDHENSMSEDDAETLYDVCAWGEDTAGVISDCLDCGSDGEPLYDSTVSLLQELSEDPCWEYLSYYIDDNERYMTEDDLYILNDVCEWAEEAFYALNLCLDEV